jgi:hypothetical protein
MLRAQACLATVSIASAVALSACAPTDPPAPQAENGDPILVHGCSTLRDDGHCVLEEGATLAVWIPTSDPRTCSATLGRRALALDRDGEAAADGWRLRLVPSVLPTRLDVACTTRPTLRLGLDLDRELPPDWLVAKFAQRPKM